MNDDCSKYGERESEENATVGEATQVSAQPVRSNTNRKRRQSVVVVLLRHHNTSSM